MALKPHQTTPCAPLKETPALEGLLLRLRSKLRLLILAEGTGAALMAVGLWCAFAFFADFVLGVPRGIRIAHGVLLVLVPIAALIRYGLRYLSRVPNRRGMAMLLERAHPGHAELFVSATDFQQSGTDSNTPGASLVASVLSRADQTAKTIDLKAAPVFQSRGPIKRLGLGAGALLLLAGASVAWPTYAGIFANRMAGGDSAWPQLTFLDVELGADTSAIRTADELRGSIARGEDLSITVHATGRIPDLVELHFADGGRAILNPVERSSGKTLFATTLRSVQTDVEFVARGGDDRREIPRVFVEVLEPPDITRLAIVVTPPAYSGQAAFTTTDADAKVLAGSRVEVLALCDTDESALGNAEGGAAIQGEVRLLPEDRLVTLTQGVFPGTNQPALAFSFEADQSLRFRYELRDSNGLTNPDPGLWSVDVIDDRAPRIELVYPGGLTLETVPSGMLLLSALVQDDFGIQDLILTAEDERSEIAPMTFTLETGPVPTPSALSGVTEFGFERMAMSALVGRDLVAGDSIRLELAARDTRLPEAGIGRSPSILVRVLTTDEYMRRVQDRLSLVRRRTSELFELQREKLRRTEELLDASFGEGEEGGTPGFTSRDRMDLAAAASGQRRVVGDAGSLLRELASLTGDVLHARVDSDAERQLEQLDLLLAKTTSRSFDPAIWTLLIEQHQKGRLGSAGFAGHLLDLTGLAIEINLKHANAATESLALAEETMDLADLQLALTAAVELQAANLNAIEDLLGRLAEWDNFQSVLSLARDVLERQKSVLERTRDRASQ